MTLNEDVSDFNLIILSLVTPIGYLRVPRSFVLRFVRVGSLFDKLVKRKDWNKRSLDEFLTSKSTPLLLDPS